MFITIAGKLGSGKSTICKILEREHGFTIYSTGSIHREIARNMGLDTLQLNTLLRGDSKYDRLIDDEVVKLAKEKQNERIVFDSRLAWHFVPESFKVYTTIDPTIAAKRVIAAQRGQEEVYADEAEARRKLIERANIENLRFLEIYGVNNFDYGNYNLVLDTAWADAASLADMVYAHYVQYTRAPADTVQIFLSPKSVYPTKAMDDIPERNIDSYIKKLHTHEDMEPITILYDNYTHYVVDGHHRLLAALITGMPFIPAKMLPAAEWTPSADPAALLQTCRLYERYGGFAYVSYPDYTIPC